MRVFIKRFWGFDPIDWPIVSFSQRGSLRRLITDPDPENIVVFVGTQTEDTVVGDRGRLLGFAMFGRKPVESRRLLTPAVLDRAPKNSAGELKWPYAVPILRAWRFPQKPGLTEVLGRQLTRAAISNVEELTGDERDRVLAVPREEVDCARTAAIRDQRDSLMAGLRDGGTFGPPPVSFTASLQREAMREAHTYVFRFGATDVWKIGWTHDLGERLRNVNAHVPHEVLGQTWQAHWHQTWATAAQAHAMEQRVLAAFPMAERTGERIRCPEDQLLGIWFASRRGAQPPVSARLATSARNPLATGRMSSLKL